jgi:hypothetical protein
MRTLYYIFIAWTAVYVRKTKIATHISFQLMDGWQSVCLAVMLCIERSIECFVFVACGHASVLAGSFAVTFCLCLVCSCGVVIVEDSSLALAKLHLTAFDKHLFRYSWNSSVCCIMKFMPLQFYLN